ncbi:MAG: low molecular weight phosphotyrosine protein phosphatase [Xanthomonadales bacterium]
MDGKQSVLFVCMGNICRSPAAEGVFRKRVADAGRDREFEIDSAGTIGYHAGNPADSRMRAAAARRGYRLDSTARRLVADDYERFGLIVAMDDDNYRDIMAGHPGAGAEVVRMVDFCTGIDATEVPDPYYGGPSGFEEVLDILDDACTGLLQRFERAE